jgi:hypothetical protein
MICPELFRDVLAAYRSNNPQVPAMSDQEIDDFLAMIKTVRSIEPKDPGQGQHGKILGRRYFSTSGALLTDSRLKGIAGPEGSRRIQLLQDVHLHFSMDVAEAVAAGLPLREDVDMQTAGNPVEQSQQVKKDSRITRKERKRKEEETARSAHGTTRPIRKPPLLPQRSSRRTCLDGVVWNCPPDCFGRRHKGEKRSSG